MSKNNVNPDHYKTAGRELPGQDIVPEIQKQKYTEAKAEQEAREYGNGSKFIPGTAISSFTTPANEAGDEDVSKQAVQDSKNWGNFMNQQQSNSRGEKSSVEKAESTRYGFEAIPATAKVDGASGGNEPTGRTAVEVMDFYTEQEIEDNAEEVSELSPSSEALGKTK